MEQCFFFDPCSADSKVLKEGEILIDTIPADRWDVSEWVSDHGELQPAKSIQVLHAPFFYARED